MPVHLAETPPSPTMRPPTLLAVVAPEDLHQPEPADQPSVAVVAPAETRRHSLAGPQEARACQLELRRTFPQWEQTKDEPAVPQSFRPVPARTVVVAAVTTRLVSTDLLPPAVLAVLA